MISRRTPLRGVVRAAMPRLLSPTAPEVKAEEERDGVGGRPRRERTWRILHPPEVCSNRSDCISSVRKKNPDNFLLLKFPTVQLEKKCRPTFRR